MMMAQSGFLRLNRTPMERALARSRWSHDRKELAALDGEIDAVEYRHFHLADVVALFDVHDVHGGGFVQPRFGVVVVAVVVHVIYLLYSDWSIDRLV